MLADLRIGDIEIGFPVVQAALSGYSDWPMRVIARRLGAPYTLCEVMLDQFLLTVKLRKRTQHFLYLTDEEHPVGGQLMGAEPEQFAAGAKRLVQAGFDVIDINFGCPVKKVLGRCRGGFHLSQPEVALEIIRRTRDVVPAQIPVTVKMRRGIDDTADSRDKFYAILDGAFQSGVAAVTVHARTVRQRYDGASHWPFLAEVKRHVGPRTVLGSGDLFSAQACLDMIRQTGVDGVTVAARSDRESVDLPAGPRPGRRSAAATAAHGTPAAGRDPRALSAGRRAVRRAVLRTADEEVRDQVFRPASAVRTSAHGVYQDPLASGLGGGLGPVVRRGFAGEMPCRRGGRLPDGAIWRIIGRYGKLG